MRLAGLLVVAATLIACKPATSTTTDSGPGSTMQNQELVEVTGTVVYDEADLAWRGLPPTFASDGPCSNGQPAAAPDAGMPALTDGGMSASTDGGSAFAFFGAGAANGPPPCLNGDTFNVEDAIKALEMLPPLKSVPLTADGTFDVTQVNVTDTDLGLVGTVNDPSFMATAAMPTGLSFSGFGLGKPPFNDGSNPADTNPVNTKNLPVYVLSVAFLNQIATAIGSDFATMTSAGMVLIHVLDSDSLTPIAGATLQHVYSSGTSTTFAQVSDGTSDTDMSLIYYLNDDLTGLAPGMATSTSGLIVRLNVGSASTYTVTTADTTQVFEQLLNGSRPGTALELLVRMCPVDSSAPGTPECPVSGG